MKPIAESFLSTEDRQNIEAAVRDAESQTSGEIVPYVVSASYHYPLADILGAAALSLAPAILLTPVLGGILWLGSQNMWVFIGLFTVFFAVMYVVVKRWLWLKRLFISDAEMDAEVSEAAVTTFFRRALHETRDRTGVLLFISVFERKVWILADKGINAKVEQGQWNRTVSVIVEGIKQKRQAAAICEAVRQVGELLKVNFPVKADDTDELQNLVVDTDHG